MQKLCRLIKSPTQLRPVYLQTFLSNCAETLGIKLLSTKTPKSSDDDWNDAWETAWLPDDLSGKNRAPWEEDVNFGVSSSDSNFVLPSEADAETKAFVEDMNENWDQRKKGSLKKVEEGEKDKGVELYSMENLKKDYRLKKQKIHAGLWMNEIEKLEEAKLGEPGLGGDDIDKLLDSCSEIFDSPDTDLNNAKIPSSSDFKNAPEGWETLSKTTDGSVWDMSQREEDILLQEFERRMAFCKFQIASFIKTHIFSRRRPIDGWKYMIEVLGPNARRGKGSVSRVPSLSDPATQPFQEEKVQIPSSYPSINRR
ncbi:GAMETE CELL DEFECTIVE 1, mitochondrial-like protein [Drosera capensis]